MGGDSNPRCACTHGGFQDRCLNPRAHPSRASRTLARAPRGDNRREPLTAMGIRCRLQTTRRSCHRLHMLPRRTLLATALAASLPARAVRAAPGSFAAFAAGVKAEAARRGISAATLANAFAGVSPNARVIELDRKQPEFTLTLDEDRGG